MSSAGTFGTLRRFATTLISIAPRRVAQSALVMIGMSATEGIGLLLLVPLLQLVGVNSGTGGALNRLTNTLSSIFLAVGLRPTLGTVLLVYIAAVYVQSVLARRESVLRLLLEQDVMKAMRVRLYRAIAGARWVYFIRERGSSYTNLLTDEIWRLGTLTYLVVDLAVVGLMTLLYVAMAVRVSPAMTGIVLVTGLLFLPTMRARLKEGRRAGQSYSKSSEALHGAIADHLASMKMARSYGTEQRHGAIFQQLSDDLSAVGIESLHANGRPADEATTRAWWRRSTGPPRDP